FSTAALLVFRRGVQQGTQGGRLPAPTYRPTLLVAYTRTPPPGSPRAPSVLEPVPQGRAGTLAQVALRLCMRAALRPGVPAVRSTHLVLEALPPLAPRSRV